MKTAWLNLRHLHDDRAKAFTAGLDRLGYQVEKGVTLKPGDADILVTWNRIGIGRSAADAFERYGRPVLVAENATWGNDFLGRRWLTICRNVHNIAHRYLYQGSNDRWDRLGVELRPWRTEGETVILPQRGIGSNPMPADWLARQVGRVRPHPGQSPNPIPLLVDLKNTAKVITWGSGAAVKAAMEGIKVESHLLKWIGEQGNTDWGRTQMLRRLAWAQWTIQEIEDGSAFDRLLRW